jgi:hypothetical protein
LLLNIFQIGRKSSEWPAPLSQTAHKRANRPADGIFRGKMLCSDEGLDLTPQDVVLGKQGMPAEDVANVFCDAAREFGRHIAFALFCFFGGQYQGVGQTMNFVLNLGRGNGAWRDYQSFGIEYQSWADSDPRRHSNTTLNIHTAIASNGPA